MKEKWEDNFQKVFSDYERKVPDGLLDDIKREIEKRKLIPNVKKSSATLIPLWVQQVAAAVAVVLIVMEDSYGEESKLPKQSLLL